MQGYIKSDYRKYYFSLFLQSRYTSPLCPLFNSDFKLNKIKELLVLAIITNDTAIITNQPVGTATAEKESRETGEEAEVEEKNR
jgi:hypothetical protein